MDRDTILELERRKKWLKRYRKNKAKINRLEEKLFILDERLYSTRSPKLSDMPRGGTPVEKEDLISEKQEIQDRINRLNKKGREIKNEIIEKIDDLEEVKQAEILEAFFIDCKSFEEIAEENGYTERHIIRTYSEAILACQFDVTN